jgi:hypothetical protein
MHGGRQQIYCLHKACKRSTEKPFPRPENLEKHLRNVHNGQGIESHEAARRDGDKPTEVVSEPVSNMQSQPSSSNRLKSKDRRQDLSEKYNRVLVADLEAVEAESSSIQDLYNAQGLEIIDLKGQLSKLRAQVEDRIRH